MKNNTIVAIVTTSFALDHSQMNLKKTNIILLFIAGLLIIIAILTLIRYFLFDTATKFVLSHRFNNRNKDKLNKRLEFQDELTDRYHTILNNNDYFLRDIEDIFRFPK